MGLPGSRSDSSLKEKHCKNKYEKKLNFYSKVKDTVASLSAKRTILKKKKLRSRQKKLKAYNLSALLECLPDVKSFQKPAREPLKQTCKSRHRLLLKESAQLKTVIQNPAFKSDALAFIHQRLQSRQPPASNNQEERPVKKQKKGKKKRPKSLSRPESMEL